MARLPGLIALALRTVRANPLHTFLSTLGLIIGVAALVGVLALGDGLEQYARDQIATTTDLQSIVVTPRMSEQVDGIYLRRTDVPHLTHADADTLAARLGAAGTVTRMQRGAVEVRVPGDTVRSAAYLQAVQADMAEMASGAGLTLRAGRYFTVEEGRQGARVLVVNEVLAERIGAAGDAVLGRTVEIGGAAAEVVGVVTSKADDPPSAIGPLAAFEGDLPESGPPTLVVRAAAVEHVPALADRVSAWLNERFPGEENTFSVATNETRVAQVRQGVLLFKVVMGLITGISVIVGGVGIMNVLLIAVTERTREIGIRKAVGARRADVVWQFLTESIAISAAGSVLGLGAGLASVFAAVPFIRRLTGVPFQAAFTWSTVLVVVVIALAVGILFGTYPAYRAARLAPVDAIRQE